MKNYKAAIYLRISKEDTKLNNSIDIQREITTNYAIKHNFNIVEEYVDNGYSGMLDTRPELNRLIRDIGKNKIDMIIIKDMSRLTRNKNLTTYYTDVFFPINGVRLISVTEYIDTGKKHETDDIIALLGIVNQGYIEDISKKIKSVKNNFKYQGKFIEGSIAYGYKKDKKNKHHIIIDNNVSNIIKKIFGLYLNGTKPSDIAKKLNSLNIQTPSQYMKLKKQSTYWTKSSINRILNNPIYCGRLVLNKYKNDFNTKKRNTIRKSEQKYLENTHEAIIEPEEFEKVQEIKNSMTTKNRQEYIYLLKGLVYCKNCGRRMTYKNSSPVRIDTKGNITGKKNDCGYFVCTQHCRDKNICNEHIKIMENDLEKIVLKIILSRLKLVNVDKIVKDVKRYEKEINPIFSEYKKLKDEMIKQESKLKMIYSKKVEKVISQEKFIEEYKKYKNEDEKIKNKLKDLKINNDNQIHENNIDKIIKNFFDTKGFDNNIIRKFIEKIEIGKCEEIKITLRI